MSFTAAEIQQLETWLSNGDGGPALVAEFRALFPGKSLTRCDAGDMGAEQPFRAFEKWELYLVDGRGHCWRCTDDPTVATGVVLARQEKRR